MPLPREPVKGVSAASIKRQWIFRRRRSRARISPVGPAPAINTVGSYIVRKYIMVQRTNVKRKSTTQPRSDWCRGTRYRRRRRISGGFDAPRGQGAQRRDDEPLLLRQDKR